jgi:hypothetical protein
MRVSSPGSSISIAWRKMFFHLLAVLPSAQPRTLSVAEARVLAGQLREAGGRRHERAVARVGANQACPFDLQALVPVPDEMLVRQAAIHEALAIAFAQIEMGGLVIAASTGTGDGTDDGVVTSGRPSDRAGF